MGKGAIEKTKTKKGKRILEDRAPKTVENDKKALFIKGPKTTPTLTQLLKDLYNLKKPLATQLQRHNDFHLFDDVTPIERMSSKFDSSLFAFGSNSKKHPNSLILGRLYDSSILDMIELKVAEYKPAMEFDTDKMTLGCKPCLLFEGTGFESDPVLRRLCSLLVDWFRGPTVNKVRLQGLETVISFTAEGENKVMMRVYRTILKKSGTQTPRVELDEMGPSVDFLVARRKVAADDLFKAACKQPKALTAKRRKNMKEDVFGNQLARIHIGRQNTDAIQTRKVKALRKDKSNQRQEDVEMRDADSGSENDDGGEDYGSEEGEE